MAGVNRKTPFDISLGLEGTHVLVTGGCGLIGKVVVHAFLAVGSRVSVIDTSSTSPFDLDEASLLVMKGSITQDLDRLFSQAEAAFGPVQCCIALASLDLSVLPQSDSLCDMDPATWQHVFDVNVNGTFLTAQRWLRGIRDAAADRSRRPALNKNVGLIVMGSESGRFGVRTMPAYAAAKSAVQGGLLLSLAQDAPRIWERARVNAVAPGAVVTERFAGEADRYGEEWVWRECEATVPLARPVPPEDVARSILFLASEKFSASVHGQVLPVDAGKTGSLAWSREELAEKRMQRERVTGNVS